VSRAEKKGQMGHVEMPDSGQRGRRNLFHARRWAEEVADMQSTGQTEGQRDRDKDELLSRTLLKNRCCFKEPSLKPVLL
jgi:hypothetical protein